MNASELRKRVDLAAKPDRMRRRLVALGALTARLAPHRIEPILVGGCALEVYTGRWARRLASLYAHELDWVYLRSRVADAGERAALASLEQDTR